MLDGKPVDDIGSSFLHDGSTLALSAAMPGLVGATLEDVVGPILPFEAPSLTTKQERHARRERDG